MAHHAKAGGFLGKQTGRMTYLSVSVEIGCPDLFWSDGIVVRQFTMFKLRAADSKARA